MISVRVGMISGTLSLILGLSAAAEKDRPPWATAEYEILLEGTRIGNEKVDVFKYKKYEVRSEATRFWPEPNRFELRYELGPSFAPKKLEVSASQGGQILEMELKHRKKDWRSEVKGKGVKKRRQDLGPREGAEIDFDSPRFNGFIVRRLSLRPGEERLVEAIQFDVPELTGTRQRQTYRRLDDGEVETRATGPVVAAAYELVSGETTHQIWTDESGVVLIMRTELPEGLLEYELVRLESKPGAWSPPAK